MRLTRYALAATLACVGAIACSDGGNNSSPTTPSTPGGTTPGSGGNPAVSCRTAAATQRSVQTFTATGQVVTTDSVCAFNTGTNSVNCDMRFTDTGGAPGTGSQTSRFDSRNDVVDEVATNPPKSLARSTETVTRVDGTNFSLTTTSTNTYDAQKRLVSTTTVTPIGIGTLTTTVTFTAWDASGRPTTGTSVSTGGGGSISYVYDDTNRTVTRNIPPNICTQTYNTNGIMIRETCTGTQPSQTDILVTATAQICK